MALCDVDESILHDRATEMQRRTGRKIKRFVDCRRLLEDGNVDAVSIATPNHTHAPIAIAAMQAGKDAYVEKPCSHNLREGRRLLAAARKHQRICQHGTQARSSPAVRQAIAGLHQGILGEVHLARAVCLRWRPSIGPAPQEPVPPGVHYDLWLGPAPRRPFSRTRFHHHWRWHWDYGNGDLGNQGVHEMDVARWGLGVGLPTRIHAAGGQFMFDDDRQSPRPLVATFEYPEQNKTLVFETRHGIAQRPGFGPEPCDALGVTFYGSEGCMRVRGFEYATYFGRRREPGPGGRAAPNEYERFLAGVRSRKHGDLGVEIEDGHLSSALGHLGNIAYRLGRTIHFDPKTETFPGDEAASTMLSRDCPKPHVIPQLT